MDSDYRVLIAGANGMVGLAIVRNLESLKNKVYNGIRKNACK